MCFSVEVETDLKKISKMLNATVNKKAFDYFYQLQKKDPKKYKYALESDDRIFTKNWAPVICSVNGQRQIRPMRYQLLPSFCEEEKYTRINPKTKRSQEIKNTFNARVDSLQTAKAWKLPFMRYHAILAIKKFYEWVEKDGKKTLIAFHQSGDYLLAPCLYDNWYSKDKSLIIQSFAIITTDPAKEVLELGHDRTPVNLKEKYIDQWLNPCENQEKKILKTLKDTKKVSFKHKWA